MLYNLDMTKRIFHIALLGSILSFLALVQINASERLRLDTSGFPKEFKQNIVTFNFHKIVRLRDKSGLLF